MFTRSSVKVGERAEQSWRISANTLVEYDIHLSTNLFGIENDQLLQHGDRGPGSRRLVLIDAGIFDSISEEIEYYFRIHSVFMKVIVVDVSEERKDVENLFYILQAMENFGLERRREPVICIGGGVLLDMGGFAASIYRRGVPYIKVPTTLLALIDASVGVKTSINHFKRRNRLGSYEAPLAAYLDPSFLQTLPKVEVVQALGEILKMAVIKDVELFEQLETSIVELSDWSFYTKDSGLEIIERSITGMVEELHDNLRELNLERLVDFGHSFSPLLELRSLDVEDVKSLTHGEAVALDVLFCSCLSAQRGLLSYLELERIFDLAYKAGLPIEHSLFYEADYLWEALEDTTRHRNGNQNLPVPIEIGKGTFINDVKYEELVKVIELFRNLVDEAKE